MFDQFLHLDVYLSLEEEAVNMSAEPVKVNSSSSLCLFKAEEETVKMSAEPIILSPAEERPRHISSSGSDVSSDGEFS